MPRVNVAKKIKSAPKLVWWSFAAGVVVAVGLIVTGTLIKDRCDLEVSDKCISLEVVDTPEARSRGLSGRSSLADNAAMLFVFEQPGKHCFWMKNMNFGIDIVWLDERQEVVGIKHDVSPETYPQSFCPDQEARYVIELNAGQARALGLREAQILPF